MDIPASVKKETPPDKKTGSNIGLEKTESEAGEQFLLLDMFLILYYTVL